MAPRQRFLLAVSRVHFPVTSLGPGRRLGIWLQGCSRRCPGCVSPETWERMDPAIPASALAESLSGILARSDGVTISGGEPLEQAEALGELLRLIKLQSAKSVLLFTGYPFDEALPFLESFAGAVDAAVCGPYIESLPQTLPLRGSDNQTLHLLTPLGVDEFAALGRPGEAPGRSMDAMFDADGTVWLAGIPKRGDMERLRAMAEGRAAPMKARP